MKIGIGRPLSRLLTLTLAILLPLALVAAVPGTASASGCATIASFSWSGNCTVQSGDASNFVEGIQTALILYSRLRSYPTCDPQSEDGHFGADTFGAVECFQSHTGLQVDGIVGPDTWGKLQSFLRQQECDGPWCYFNFDNELSSEFFRQYTSTGVWYVTSNSDAWIQMNTGGPD